jgi:hypothetical protein
MSVYSELKLQLVRTYYRDSLGGALHESRLIVGEPHAIVNTRQSWPGIYEVAQEMTLHQLLTLMVEGMEKVGVRFNIEPARPATPASTSVALKKPEVPLSP